MSSVPVRVAVITHFPSCPENPCGGVEAVSVHLVRALAELEDLDVHVISACPGVQRLGTSRWNRATVHRLPRPDGSLLRYASGKGRCDIRDCVQKLKPSVVHAHDTYGIMTKGLPVPRVFTIHGFIHEDTRVSGERFAWLRSHLWKWLETRAWADQPNIVSISPYVRERLGKVATGTIHDIANPVDRSFFSVKRREQGARIYCAAAVCRRKNTLGLLAAFESLVGSGQNVQLRLSGSVPETAYVRQVREFIRTRHLEEKVCVLGRIDYAAVRQELASASVFALVSLEENSPMGIEEAMAAGVPVVTSNRCGMPYMVRDGETGFLVDPNRPQQIASRIGRLLQDSALRERMGARARQVAMERFHPHAVAQRTRDVYLQAIEEHHGQ